MLDLRGRHQDSRGNLLSLARVLLIVILHLVLRQLGVHESAVLRLVDRDLTDVRLTDDARPLILVQARVAPDSFHAVGRHRRISWRGQHLIRHVEVGRWRVQLL